jgi:hypothetical protein
MVVLRLFSHMRKNSIAVNTHGDLSSRGIIAAAVYVEDRPSFGHK